MSGVLKSPIIIIIIVIIIIQRNINNLIYADDTTLMAESEEKLKSLLVGVKEGSENAGLNSWHLIPSLHGKWMGKQRKQWEQ